MRASPTIRRNQRGRASFVVLLLAVPITIDEVGKRNFFAGMGAGFALLLIALYLYFNTQDRDEKSS